MITCHISSLEARCRERGYTLEQVRACIVSENGDQIIVDETHADYPHAKPGLGPMMDAGLSAANGPGTELKKLLARIGITASPQCRCNKRAALMNIRGCDWCESNIDTIVRWLREEATSRGLPFLDAAGKMLVRRAISNARKEASRARPPGSQVHDQG